MTERDIRQTHNRVDGSDTRSRPCWTWEVPLEHSQIMGVLNVTPDSFFDGGRYHHDQKAQLMERAADRGEQLWREGAHYLDVGGESSRPGALPVSYEEECARVLPVITELKRRLPKSVISIDTVKPKVAHAALEAGASIVNDISGLRHLEMIEVVSAFQAGVVIMHMRGTPKTMQEGDLRSPDMVEETLRWLEKAATRACQYGIREEQIAIDVGIGFGKTVAQNIDLINQLDRFKELGFPILVGISRKSMIGAITGAPVEHRLPGSLAAMIEARRRGAHIFRVHDVEESVQALQVMEAIHRGGVVWDEETAT